jgi:hypothetical protein
MIRLPATICVEEHDIGLCSNTCVFLVKEFAEKPHCILFGELNMHGDSVNVKRQIRCLQMTDNS